MSSKMKIAFFSRSFGIRGTAGTYLFLEKISNKYDYIVFAPLHSEHTVYESDNLSITPIKNLSPKNENFQKNIVTPLERFNPDLIYIFNFPNWFELLHRLKQKFPNKNFVLDIKTPLLVFDKQRREKIQEEGKQKQIYLDAIATLSKESVETWIPNCNTPIMEYPLGVDLGMFHPSYPVKERQSCRNFVYVGSLHPLRQTERLIRAFHSFSQQVPDPVYLDIFGNGPDLNPLINLVEKLQASNHIRLKGLCDHKKLLKRLSRYDAGIAWVPYEHYDKSPSLKILEFMASGIPVLASDTTAHKSLVDDGLSFYCFSNHYTSMINAFKNSYKMGFAKETIINNISLLKRYNYEYIIDNYHKYFFEKIIKNDKKASQRKIYNKKLTIVLLCNSLSSGKGGAERVSMELANEMSRRGHFVYISYKNQGPPAYLPDDNVKLLPYDKIDKSLKKRIHSINPDVFFAFYFNRQLFKYYYLVHNSGIPFGMQECTNPERLCINNWGAGKFGPVIANWEREIVASGAARIRLVMPGYKDSFPDYIQPMIFAYPNPAFKHDKPIELNYANLQRKNIIIINGFKRNKNLITLLKAFSILASEFHNWDIKVVGRTDGREPHKLEIHKFIKDRQLTNRVIFKGPTDRIFEEYASSQIHVLPSLSEGCPTCILEAMSVGLPSIGFADCPGTNELIKHERNGLLAETEERVAGLKIALRRVMSNNDFRIQLSHRALEDANQYTPKKIYDQWEHLFYEASTYKSDPERLFQEQMAIDPERAMHARRMRAYYAELFGG